ncbi:hypothetical protein B0I37DRAFT_386776 [Chaetomium sp. MPI-CAGE-AT-0009]|nr:hypothetical protein B0I37DRAFT_386776 [Chaetomium sp. MPI-CAGE-AT-0009]
MANDQLSRVEVAARGMDLLTAIFNSPGTRAVANIARWLGREGVDEEELRLCLEQSSGLVYGNDNCEDFYKAVTLQPPITKIAKDFVAQGTSGSLGGQMAAHPHLRWLTSTVAGLFQFHSQDFIHATLLAFIIQANRNRGELLSETKAKYDTRGITIKRVLRKLVDSVWFNVVNSGTAKSGITGILPLPKGLVDICEDGHYLKPFELGSCLAQIRTAAHHGEIIIESMYIIKDLVWWLWYHFTGNLTVVVGGKILEDKPWESADGVALSRIEIRIRKSCTPGTCDPDVNSRSSENTMRAWVAVAGNAQDLFETTTYNRGGAFPPDRGAAVRTELYDVHLTRLRDGAISTPIGFETLKVRARSTAVIIVAWLLDLPVSGTVEGDPDLAFAVQPESGDREGSGQSRRTPRVMDLVARSPSILNMGWDDYEKRIAFVFTPPPTKEAGRLSGETGLGTGPIDFQLVLHCYPILRDLANHVSALCTCMLCRHERVNRRPTRGGIFQKGCFQNQVLMGVMQLVAHAIADCFGCEDASAPLPGEEDLGVLALLSSVAGGIVRWNDWFAVASRVFLGCPDLLKEQPPRGFYQCPRLAVQYGGLATLAPWLDMSADLRFIKPFSMARVKGRIGVLRSDPASETGGFSIQSMIESQGERIQRNTEGGCIAPSDPHTTLETDMILVPEEKNRYDLWLRVRTKQYSRLIDPSSAIRALPHLLGNQHLCPHTVDESSGRGDRVADIVQAGSFDQVLGTWGAADISQSMVPFQDSFCGLSPLCDSHLRLNITASLTLHHARILTGERTCVACLDWNPISPLNQDVVFAVSVSGHVLEERHGAGATPMIEWGEGHN